MDRLSEVKNFWDAESCGERYWLSNSSESGYQYQKDLRYKLEPWVKKFAAFETVTGLDVLEVGVGMGADHEEFALAKPKTLTGIDLTDRAVAHARQRFAQLALKDNIEVGNAEEMRFANETFDYVYSCGVIHHSPNAEAIVSEIHRVLRPGGVAKIMIYHRYSPVGCMLWFRYALLKGKPWLGLDTIYDQYLESPGTKAYTVKQTRNLFSSFSTVATRVTCSSGDLLIGNVGQRHQGPLLNIAKKIWPRKILKFISTYYNFGLYLLIEAKK